MEVFNRVDDTLNLSVTSNTKIICSKAVGGKVSIVHVSIRVQADLENLENSGNFV